MTACNGDTMLNVVARLEALTKRIYEKNPELFFLLKAFQAKEARETEEAPETIEN